MGVDGTACLGQVRFPATSTRLRCEVCAKKQRLAWDGVERRRFESARQRIYNARRTSTKHQQRVEKVAQSHPGRAELIELARQAGLIKIKEKN